MPQYPEWSWLSIFLQKAFSETKGWFWWVLGENWLEFLVQCMEQKLTWFSLSWGCEHHRKLKPEIKMNPDREAGTGALLPTLTERNQDFCSWNIPRDWVPVEINCSSCLSGISEEGGAGGLCKVELRDSLVSSALLDRQILLLHHCDKQLLLFPLKQIFCCFFFCCFFSHYWHSIFN